MYTFQSRVRYSEVNCQGLLTLSNIANYFQDCSTFHSEDAGVGISYLKAQRRAWILSSWQIVVNRFPSLGEEITVGTWAASTKGLYANRNFVIQDKDGADCAYANSIWIYLDTEKGLPCRLTKDITAHYPEEEPYPMEYAPRKISLPDCQTEAERVLVTPLSIDTNNHMNNSQYVRIAESCLPKGFPIRQMRAEYRLSAHLGDTIVAKVSDPGAHYTVSLENPEGTVFAIVEFQKKNSENI